MERQKIGDSTPECKNVVITGASKGIGKELAMAFARENASVFICARNEIALYNTTGEIQTRSPEATKQDLLICLHGRACRVSEIG